MKSSASWLHSEALASSVASAAPSAGSAAAWSCWRTAPATREEMSSPVCCQYDLSSASCVEYCEERRAEGPHADVGEEPGEEHGDVLGALRHVGDARGGPRRV